MEAVPAPRTACPRKQAARRSVAVQPPPPLLLNRLRRLWSMRPHWPCTDAALWISFHLPSSVWRLIAPGHCWPSRAPLVMWKCGARTAPGRRFWYVVGSVCCACLLGVPHGPRSAHKPCCCFVGAAVAPLTPCLPSSECACRRTRRLDALHGHLPRHPPPHGCLLAGSMAKCSKWTSRTAV